MSEDLFQILPSDGPNDSVVPGEMLRDLHAIALLDAGAVDRIADQLAALPGSAAKEDVEGILKACLPGSGPELAASVARAMLNLPGHNLSPILSAVDHWRKATPERMAYLTDEAFSSLSRNLPALVADYPVVLLLRKASRLLREVGNEFKGAAFYCDLRPVFDDRREHIEAFVMLANMRLLYVDQANSAHACEIALTEDELRGLIREGERALSKLSVLRECAGRLLPPA